MTFLGYLALGIASVGLSYSVYMEIKNPDNSTLPCPQLLELKHKMEKEVAIAEPKRTWYGIPFGTVVTDTHENIRKHATLESMLTKVNSEYMRRCESYSSR